MEKDEAMGSAKNGEEKKAGAGDESETGSGRGGNGNLNGRKGIGKLRDMEEIEEPREKGELGSIEEIDEIGVMKKMGMGMEMGEDEDVDEAEEQGDDGEAGAGADAEDRWHDGYEDDCSFKKTRILTNFWARAVVWYLLPGVLVVLLSAVIAVSRMTVKDSLQVFGHGEVEFLGGGKKAREAGIGKAYLPSGSRGALRVAVLRRLLGKHLKPISGKIYLVENGGTGSGADKARRWKLFEGDSRGMEGLAANFEMPDVEEGMYRLEVVVTSPEEEIRGELPVEVFSLSPEERGVGGKPKETERERNKAGVKTRAKLVTFDPPKDVKRRRMTPPDAEGRIVELSAESGHRLVGELPQMLYLRAVDEQGNPERIKARVGLLSGIVGRKKGGDWLMNWVDTGPLGMFFMEVMPRRAFIDMGIQYRAESKFELEGKEESEEKPEGVETTGGDEDKESGDENRKDFAGGEAEKKHEKENRESDRDKKVTYITEEVEHRKRQRFGCRPGQLVLQVSRRMVRPGETVFVEASTLPQSGSMYLDVYWRGIKVHVANARVEGGRAEFWVDMPDVEGVVYLQAYMDMVNPGQAVGVKALFVSKEFDREQWRKSGRQEELKLKAAVRVIRAASGKLREMSDEYVENLTLKGFGGKEEKADRGDVNIEEERVRERELLLFEGRHLEGVARLLSGAETEEEREEIKNIDEIVTYALSRLEKGYHPPRLIANTMPGARLELAARKKRLQRTFLSLFGVGAAGFFLILGFLMSTWMKESREAEKERERLMQDCGEDGSLRGETAEKESGEDGLHRTNIGAGRKTGGWRMGAQIGVLVGIVIFTVISVIVLVANLVWQI